MAGKQVPVVLVLRFTTYASPMTFWSPSIPVAGYAGLNFVFWNGALLGAMPTVQPIFQESNDGVNFTDCSGGPGPVIIAQAETQLSATITMAWFRFGVALGGTNTVVTCWAHPLVHEMRQEDTWADVLKRGYAQNPSRGRMSAFFPGEQEYYVAEALKKNAVDVRAWAAGESPVLTIRGKAYPRAIGRGQDVDVATGAGIGPVVDRHRAVVVLRKNSSGSWHVQSAYPE